jgi:pimeloyl-ACP methyl ester carboxylesterase
MRNLALRLSTMAALAAVLVPSCVEVRQDPPFTSAQFTVADFDPTTGNVPFPNLTPCPTAPDPVTGACPTSGTFACANAACTSGRVAVPIAPCQAGQVPCRCQRRAADGSIERFPSGCTPCDSATTAQLKGGLNTLDGFGTYALLRTSFNKGVDPASVSSQTAFLLGPTGPAAFKPTVVTLDSGDDCARTTLLFEPDRPATGNVTAPVRPLAPKTAYLAVVTRGVRDAQGQPVEPDRTFAFLRSRSPLANPDGTAIPGSLLEGLRPADVGCTQGDAAAQAACVRAVRASLEASRIRFDAILRTLEAAPPPLTLPRENIAVLWPVLTQSIADALVGIRAQILPTIAPSMTVKSPPGLPPGGILPGVAVYCPGGTCPPPFSGPQDIKVNHFRFGCVRMPMLLNRPSATFRTTSAGLPMVTPTYVPYVLAVPTATPPATGWKVVIFGHALTRWRYDMIALANTLASQGFATIAIDHVWHGDRSNLILPYLDNPQNPNDRGSTNDVADNCVPSAPAANPSKLCANPTETYDPATDTCSGGSAPVASGDRLLPLPNFFAVRDNFRQGSVDLSQLVATLIARRTEANTPEFDATNIYYVGQDLGGLIGTLFMATEPVVRVGVLNVAGGGFSYLLRESAPLCKPIFDGLAALGLCVRPDATNRPCECAPTAAYTSFVQSAQWILDQADPVNYARHLIDDPLWCSSGTTIAPCSVLPGGTGIRKKILFQKMENDPVIPNSTTHALRAAAGPGSCYRERATTPPNHGYLLSPGSSPTADLLAATAEAQGQVVNFILSGGTSTMIGDATKACP